MAIELRFLPRPRAAAAVLRALVPGLALSLALALGQSAAAVVAAGSSAAAPEAACAETSEGACAAAGSDGDLDAEELSVLQRRQKRRRSHQTQGARDAKAARGKKWFPLPEGCIHAMRRPDWIVVGGGGAGCAAAAALADAGENVLVLERGPNNLDVPDSLSAFGWPAVVNEVGQFIRFEEGTWGVVGKVLGGGTSINAGLFIADRPEWFQRALPDVNVTLMQETYEYLARELATPTRPSEFNSAFASALSEAGRGNVNLSDPRLNWQQDDPFVAYSSYNYTQPGAPRSASAALLHKRKGMPNLCVATDALVHGIKFHQKHARGVTVSFKAHYHFWKHFIRAKKGVLLSAGAVFTPQLLQVSGIGPKDVVNKLHARLVSELPEVGRNFIDRIVTNVAIVSPKPIQLSTGYAIDVHDEAVVEAVGGGNVTSEFAIATLGVVPPQQRSAALRVAMRKLFDSLPRAVLDELNNMAQPAALDVNTRSRGSIEAVSRGVYDPPRISANYFADARDYKSHQDRLNMILKLFNTTALDNFTVNKYPVSDDVAQAIYRYAPQVYEALSCWFKPESNDRYTLRALPCLPSPYYSQEALDEYLNKTLVSSYHYFGTAAAGTVVNGTDFSVKGTTGLHVLDASVIPIPTTVNPQATIIALGYYGGRILASRAR
eukprot:TRINITY_DN18477_c0_g1_i1.p1 TRINITY_DN18477_c0_g1~~TRINITY_DN18477_c0_g1_i1.p1  ORF type:complete len:695 (-),score=172.83 TRINITY_DN18477_c0_g1_i1:203-2188(-)